MLDNKQDEKASDDLPLRRVAQIQRLASPAPIVDHATVSWYPVDYRQQK